MPLKALQNGSKFSAEKLQEEDRKKNFLCPNCPSRLIPVIPKEKRIKHFRHLEGENHYEPETDEHLTGKSVLLELSTSLGYEAETEYRIGEHVTDIFIKGNQPLAVEFQCSMCHSREVANRNRTYSKEGIAPLWILGENFFKGNPAPRISKIEKEIYKTQRLLFYLAVNLDG